MTKKTILCIALILVLLIALGYVGGKLYFLQLANSHEDLYDALENEFGIEIPNDVSMHEVFSDQSWPGDGLVYYIIIIPTDEMDSFAKQISEIGWSIYPEETDAEVIEDKFFSLMDQSFSLQSISKKGYALFRDKDGDNILYNSNGEEFSTADYMRFFYDVTTGRLYVMLIYT